MQTRTTKEYLHLRDGLTKALLIVSSGREEYDRNELLQEAGDSLMMKIGEAANRLGRAGEPAPAGLTWARVVSNGVRPVCGRVPLTHGLQGDVLWHAHRLAVAV
ncbi:MAG: hypothetical protein ABI692_04290 [Terracoccus sp.]